MSRFTPKQREILGASLTLSTAVGVFSIAYGVLAVSAGASVLQTCALSLLTFTGASQLSAVGVIGSGGSASAAVGGALMLAARNAIYGLAVARHLRGSLGKRLFTAQFVIDETTAMMTAQGDPQSRRFAFWWTAIPLFSMWNAGTLLGALLGSAVDPQAFGLDVAFSAAFVAMLAPHLARKRGRQAAALGAVICVLLVPFVPVGVPILASGLAIFIGVRPSDEVV